MNKQKQVYLSPETETLVVQVEEMICQSGEFDIKGFVDDSDELNGFVGL